ncbi:hypothetical protein HELRODRAFT_193984 [Helobdella robusta]|uniref:Uncharacterized protein n=1 Tax=Helobdella robusta TaxID=6412 RepID=T1FVJ4_HELRO|nr:hypothetical protein HELRODRAFT_193984 [Helobdella robusta]ESN93603.1 hypothetical protein HELRODRAFT_193984 [Helobdella robusta]
MGADDNFKLLPKIINGGIAGIVGVTCVFPIDLVKTRLQNQQVGSKMYANLWDCAVKTFRKEGFFGMYRAGKAQLDTAVGGGAGLAQVQKLSATRLAMGLLRERGIFGLYKGLGATFTRDVTFSAIYFPLFAHLNSLGKRREGSSQAVFYVSFAAGLAAGSLACFMVTPLDVVKTRLQTINKAEGEKVHRGIVDCLIRTYREEGWRALFKGGACRMLVIAPLFGIAQTVYYFGVAEAVLGSMAK